MITFQKPLRLVSSSNPRFFSIAPRRRKSALALRGHNPENGSQSWSPLQRYQRNIFEVRRMEHHVLAVAMEATANEKYYNNLLWLEYSKRCRDLVDASFTGRDLSKVLSALARSKQSIVDKNAAHARISEDIIAIAEKRILGASSSKISFTTPQQIAWVAFGISKLCRLGAEQLASLARSFTELLTNNPNVRLSAKDCGMAIEAFRGGDADLLECLSARLYPGIHTYDFSEWKVTWVCLATAILQGQNKGILPTKQHTASGRALASIFPVLEENISELAPHEVCRLICSVKHAPELGESMASLPASLERALSKRIVELREEFSVADIAAVISGLRSSEQLKDPHVVGCLLTRLADLGHGFEYDPHRFIVATCALCDAAVRLDDSCLSLVYTNYKMQSLEYMAVLISSLTSMEDLARVSRHFPELVAHEISKSDRTVAPVTTMHELKGTWMEDPIKAHLLGKLCHEVSRIRHTSSAHTVRKLLSQVPKPRGCAPPTEVLTVLAKLNLKINGWSCLEDFSDRVLEDYGDREFIRHCHARASLGLPVRAEKLREVLRNSSTPLEAVDEVRCLHAMALANRLPQGDDIGRR
ncbi:hypothetical protein FOZ60_011900 [Perkinsus olseni]|uniref:Uncharacterized protein n=1 Tax=Perkinsus olseni TaxID=32597 RepID=A0A7J6PB59_PEROL|nr:hypothetical protein FOZ60_011900 [Perkinsus olseni]